MFVVYLFIFGAIGVAVWHKWFRKSAAGSSSIRTQMAPFHTRGNQVKPNHLAEELVNLDRDALKRNNGFFEFYPNQKIVAFVVPPTTQIYCHCNLMQYLDLTRAIEKKILYGVNPPRPTSFETAA